MRPLSSKNLFPECYSSSGYGDRHRRELIEAENHVGGSALLGSSRSTIVFPQALKLPPCPSLILGIIE